jgi:glycosyltransferase involved in cell wall biosynthesis
MNLLHVSAGYAPWVGGAQTYLREMCERFAAQGHRVTVITSDIAEVDRAWSPKGRAAMPLRETHHGVEVIRCPVAHLPLAPLSFYAMRRLHTLIAPIAPQGVLRAFGQRVPPMPALQQAVLQAAQTADLIHAINITFEHPVMRAAEAARALRKPFVLTPFVHIGDAHVARNYLMPHQVALMHQADAVLTQTGRESAALRALGIHESRLHVLGMGVNLPARDGADAAAFRAREGISATAPVITFMGSLTFDKGAVHVLRAMLAVWQARPNAVVVFAGDAPGPGGFEDAFSAIPAGQRSQVKRAGVVHGRDKQNMLAATDVFAMPSRVDSFGIVYLEAWMHGKPVIGADAGGVPDVIASGEDGLIVPFGDTAALAQAMLRLISNDAEREAMGGAGRRKVEARFTWDSRHQVLRDIYLQLHARSADRPSIPA